MDIWNTDIYNIIILVFYFSNSEITYFKRTIFLQDRHWCTVKQFSTESDKILYNSNEQTERRKEKKLHLLQFGATERELLTIQMSETRRRNKVKLQSFRWDNGSLAAKYRKKWAW